MASAAIGPWLDSQPANSGPVACSRWYASCSIPVASVVVITVLPACVLAHLLMTLEPEVGFKSRRQRVRSVPPVGGSPFRTTWAR